MSVNTVDLAKLQRQYQNGGSWFYWVGGLSIINAVIALSGGTIRFIFGLGVTDIVAAISASEDLGMAGKVIGFALTVFIAGIAVLFGFLAKKGQLWVFVVGGVLYLIDAVILFMVGKLMIGQIDWLSIAFHAWVLFMVVQGFRAGLAIKRLPPEVLQELLAQQQRVAAATAAAMQPRVAQAPQADQEQPK